MDLSSGCQDVGFIGVVMTAPHLPNVKLKKLRMYQLSMTKFDHQVKKDDIAKPKPKSDSRHSDHNWHLQDLTYVERALIPDDVSKEIEGLSRR
jgi:hypothetical protein